MDDPAPPHRPGQHAPYSTRLVEPVEGSSLQVLIDHVPAAIAMFDRGMRYLHASRRYREDYRLGDRPLAGESHYDVFPEIGEAWKEVHERALAGEVVHCDLDRLVRLDGTEQFIRWEAKPWRDAAGAIGGIVLFTEDVTEATRASREARQLNAWLDLAIGAGGARAWQWDLERGRDGLTELRPPSRPGDESFPCFAPDQLAVLERSLWEACASGEARIELTSAAGDGPAKTTLCHAKRVSNPGDPPRFVGIAVDVTDTARAVREASDAQYGEVLDAAPDGVLVIGEARSIELSNAEVGRLFGYARSEVLGRPLGLLIPELADASDPSSFADKTRELTGRRRDGTTFPIEVSFRPHPAAAPLTVSVGIRDITERKRLEAEASLTADRLRSAVESIDNAFALFDDRGALVLCNQPYAQLLGRPEGIPKGTTYAELLDRALELLRFENDDARARYRDEQLHAFATKNAWAYEVRTSDGRAFRITNRRTPEGSVVTTVWDLSDELRRSEELRQARAAAEAGSAAKSEFLASMSHELRTPLNAVLGFAQLLTRDKRDPLSPRHQERAQRILAAGEYLLRLVDDVLDLTKLEAGGEPMAIEALDIEAVMADTRAALAAMQSRYGVEVRFEPPPPEVPRLRADRARVVQILASFGSNALKFNKRGGSVTISVGPGRAGRVRITVADDGIGIPVEKQKLLFSAFHRAGQETGPIEGAGLGLVIARGLATLMQGEVGCESVAGEGSTFWVELPAAGDELPAPSLRPRSLRSPGPLASEQGTVVFVTADGSAGAFMHDVVTTHFEVELLLAPDPSTAIDVARRRRPRVVLVAVEEEAMNAHSEWLEALRSAVDPHVVVIAVGPLRSLAGRREALAAGFSDYVSMAFAVDGVVSALQRVLGPPTRRD